jgi:hypothetical protein
VQMKPPLSLVTALALVVSAIWGHAPALAQERQNDARCFLVSNLFARSAPDAKAKEVARNSTFFFLGRLPTAEAQIQAEIAAQARAVTTQNAGPTMQACARVMLAKQAEVNAIGQRLRQPNRK